MLNKEIITSKVIAKLKQSRLEEEDYDVIVDYISKNIDNIINLKKYFESFNKRNKLSPTEKKKLIFKLKEKVDTDRIKPESKEVFIEQGLI